VHLVKIYRHRISIGVFIAFQRDPKGKENNFKIEQERTVLKVPYIRVYKLQHSTLVGKFAPQSTNLRPAGNPGTKGMPDNVKFGETAIFFGMTDHMRPRPDDGHVAYQHVEKLGKFIKTCFSQKRPDPGNAIIVTGSWPAVGFRVYIHASKLITPETSAIQASAQLYKENRARRLYLNENGKYRTKPAEDKNYNKQRKKDIE